MGRVLKALERVSRALLDALLAAALLAVYALVVIPVGLLWRALSPHPSWRRAARSRWRDPERSPSSLDDARRQF